MRPDWLEDSLKRSKYGACKKCDGKLCAQCKYTGWDWKPTIYSTKQTLINIIEGKLVPCIIIEKDYFVQGDTPEEAMAKPRCFVICAHLDGKYGYGTTYQEAFNMLRKKYDY